MYPTNHAQWHYVCWKPKAVGGTPWRVTMDGEEMPGKIEDLAKENESTEEEKRSKLLMRPGNPRGLE